MRNVMRLVLGVMLSFGLFISAKAQVNPSNPENAPAPDDIICLQTDENVFECSLSDPNFFRDGELEDFEMDQYDNDNTDIDLYNDQTDQEYYLETPTDENIIRQEDDRTIEDDYTREDQMWEQEPLPGTDFNDEDNMYDDRIMEDDNREENNENDKVIMEVPSEETTASN